MKKLADELNSTYEYLYKVNKELQEFIEEDSDKNGMSAEDHELYDIRSDVYRALRSSEKLVNLLLSSDTNALNLKEELSKLCMLRGLKDHQAPIIKFIKSH